jgi:virulence-associated protein VapD
MANKKKYIITDFDPDSNLLAQVLLESNLKSKETMDEIEQMIREMKNAHGFKKSQLSIIIDQKLSLVKELMDYSKKLNEFMKSIQPE